MTRQMLFIKSLACAVLFIAANAVAQNSDDGVTSDRLEKAESRLDVTLQAGAWLPRIGAMASFGPGSPGKIDLDQSLALNDSEPSMNIELAIRKHDDFELQLGGFDFSADASGTYVDRTTTYGDLRLRAGDSFASSFDMTSVFAEVNMWRFNPIRNRNNESDRCSDGSYVADLRFAPQIGGRWVDVEHNVRIVGGDQTTADGQWLTLYGGMNIEFQYKPEQTSIPWLHMFELDMTAGGGPAFGGNGGVIWHVRGGLTWHFNPHAGVTLGYRLLELDAENDDFELEGGLQGLYVGGTFRF